MPVVVDPEGRAVVHPSAFAALNVCVVFVTVHPFASLARMDDYSVFVPVVIPTAAYSEDVPICL